VLRRIAAGHPLKSLVPTEGDEGNIAMQKRHAEAQRHWDESVKGVNGAIFHLILNVTHNSEPDQFFISLHMKGSLSLFSYCMNKYNYSLLGAPSLDERCGKLSVAVAASRYY
jgi:hypothetical protein